MNYLCFDPNQATLLDRKSIFEFVHTDERKEENETLDTVYGYILDWQIAVLTESLQQVGNDRCIGC